MLSLSKYLDPERFIHSIKTAAAVFIGTLVAYLVGSPAGQWIVVTIIVVMCAQIYVGGVLQKSYFRFLGTLVGCLLATLTLLTVGHTPLSTLVVITLSSLLFSYFSIGQEMLAYTGTLGAVTTAIILLGQSPTFSYAAQRFLEISTGLFIATMVSQFILPIHASKHLMRTQANTLRQLLAFYQHAIKKNSQLNKNNTPQQDLDDAITNSLLKQRQLAKESAPEPRFGHPQAKKFIKILHCERELFRAITMMHSALDALTQHTDVSNHLIHADNFHDPIIEALEVLINAPESLRPKQTHIHLPSFQELYPSIRNNTLLTTETALAFDAFLFSIRIVLANLEKLATLYELSTRPTKTAE